MAAIYTVQFEFSIALYFPNVTLKTYSKWRRADFFSASQIDCTPLDSQMRAGKHQTGASRVFSVTGDHASYSST